MKGMKSLIRLHRWQLDEQRRKLANLEGLAAEMQGQIDRIAADLQAEAHLAGESVENARAYSGYLAGETARRDRLRASLAELEREVEEAKTGVADAFRRVKTFEISLRNRERQHDGRKRRRRQSEQDEIALGMHQRKSAV